MKLHNTIVGPSTSDAKILIVEDDKSLCMLLTRTVEKLGYKVSAALSAEDAINVFSTESIDLILMDIVLPGMDGFGLCEYIRTKSNVPIIVLSSLCNTEDLVRMLELGADEYVTKPFHFAELEMRIEAQMRRALWSSPTDSLGVLKAGGLVLNANRRTAHIGVTEIELTDRECSVLRCLMSEPGIPISIADLYETVWGQCNGQEKTMVPTVIQRLRSKLEADPVSPSVIVNVRGYGYKFTTSS